MPTFIALLRGVNVGKGKRVPMAELRDLLSGLGFAEVTTLLNSGNAVFRATGSSPAKPCRSDRSSDSGTARDRGACHRQDCQ